MNIVKNKQIKEVLLARWKELGLKNSNIVTDALERYPEIKITNSRLSKWIKKSEDLSETQVLYLCTRYSIPVTLVVGNPVLTKENKLSLVIPKHDELQALKNLEIVFPKRDGKK